MLRVIVIIMIGGIFGMIIGYRRVLNILLRLEFIIISLLGGLGIWLINGYGDLIFFFFFIIFMVGEGVLGLRILVSLVRGYGDDRRLELGLLLC